MVLVWICVIVISTGNGLSVTTVDNIATQADCERIGQRTLDIRPKHNPSVAYHGGYTCTQVRKVR